MQPKSKMSFVGTVAHIGQTDRKLVYTYVGLDDIVLFACRQIDV